MFKKVFEFEAISKSFTTKFADLEKVGVWTDGLGLISEAEPNWPCAYKLKPNKKYKITIEIDED